MFRYSSKIRSAAAIAARTAALFAVNVFVLIVVRAVLNGLVAAKWDFDWRRAAAFSAVFGATWFRVQFVYTFVKLCAAAPTEAILGSAPSSSDTKTGSVGFVAMEYYDLISNRIFDIMISPEWLC